MFSFLRNVKNEMKDVTWPTYHQNLKDTWSVVVGSLSFAIYLGALDWLFQFLTEKM